MIILKREKKQNGELKEVNSSSDEEDANLSYKQKILQKLKNKKNQESKHVEALLEILKTKVENIE